MTPRSASLDALRVFGLITVVLGHVWGEETRLSIYTWHVPLFFFLTGYLWKSGRSLSLELSRRFTSLIVPLLSWGLVLLALVLSYMFYQQGFSSARVIADIRDGGFHTRPFIVFWFVLVLFFVSVAMRALERLPLGVIWTISLVGLLAANTQGEHLANTPLYIGLTLPCLVFTLAGVGFRRVRNYLNLYAGVSLLIIPATLITLGYSNHIDIKPGDFGTPVISIILAIAISSGLVIVFEAINFSPVSSPVVTLLASAGLALVLGHAAVLTFTSQLHPVVSAIAALIIPWSVGLIASRTPFAVFVTGASRALSAPGQSFASRR